MPVVTTCPPWRKLPREVDDPPTEPPGESPEPTGEKPARRWARKRAPSADLRIAPGAPPAASRKRRLLVWGLIALAALFLVVGSLTVWVKREVLDTDEWVKASGEMLQNDDIRQALSVSLVDTLFTKGDLQGRLEDRLPADLEWLAEPIVGQARARAVPAANELLQASRTQVIWEDINRRVHTTLVAVLEGEPTSGLVTTDEGQVVLDLQPLVDELADQLGLDALQERDAATFVLMTSDDLKAAQQTVRAVKVLSVLIGLVVIGLLALALYLARGFRRQTLRAIGFTLILVGILLFVARRLLGEAIIAELTSEATEPAGIATWLIATSLLADVATLLVAYGIIALLGAVLAGPTRAAVWIRRRLAPTFRHRPLIVYGFVVLVFLLLLLFGPAVDARRLIGAAVFGLLLWYGVRELGKQTMREFPEAEVEPEPEPPPPAAPTSASAS
jgi:hypothetical protein